MKQSLVNEFWGFLNTIVTSTVTTTVSDGKSVLGNLFEEYEKDVKKSGSEDIVWESSLTFSQFYYGNDLGSVNKPTKIYVSLVGEDTETTFDKDPAETTNYPNLGFFTFVGCQRSGTSSSVIISIKEDAIMDDLPAGLQNIHLYIESSSENDPAIEVCVLTAARSLEMTNVVIQRVGTGARVFLNVGVGGVFITLQGTASRLQNTGVIHVDTEGELTVTARGNATFASESVAGTTGGKLNLINETIIFQSDPVPRTLEAMDILFPSTTNVLYCHPIVAANPQ